MTAPLLDFPGRDAGRLDASLGVRAKPVLKKFDAQDAVRLLGVARKTWASTQVLSDLVGSDRAAARDAGVETIAIELGTDRARLGDVLDALEDSARTGKPVEISNEGLEVLRRSERLGAEAMSNLARFAPGSLPGLSGSSLPGTGTIVTGFVTGLVVVSIVAIAWSLFGRGE